MATNQGKKSGHAKGNEKVAQEAGQRLRQEAEHLGDRVRTGLESAQSHLQHTRREAADFVGEHPGSTVLVGFGLGFGLGLLLTTLLLQEDKRSWWERHTPDALRDLEEKVSRLAHHLPDSLSLRR